MMPLLTYPLALIALTALPTLAAIYLLRNRYRRNLVSSLIFWRLQARIKEGGAKRDRLQLPLVFFLELLALLLLVCAATGPRWQLPMTIRPLIVVLDNSVSMLAGAPSDNPRVRAEQALRSLLKERRFRSLRMILAGPLPRTVASPSEVSGGLEDLLAGWTCHEPVAALDAAVVLAVEVGRREADVLVLSDHAPEGAAFPDTRVRWWAFGKHLPNLAFVNARRSLFGEEDRCLLEVANYSPLTMRATLTLRTGTNVWRQSVLNLEAGRNERVVLNVPSLASPLEATLSDDTLAADNRVVLVSVPRKKVRVQNALTNEALGALVNRALDATGLRLPAGATPELIIHQARQKIARPEAWEMQVIKGEKSSSYSGPFVVDASHPLAQGLNLSGVIWAGPATNPAVGVPVVSAGNVALLTTQEDAVGRQHLTLFFDPDLSTLPATPNWPVLFWNLLSWRIAESPGLKESNLRLGGEAEFRTRSPLARVVGPNGDEKDILVRSNPVLYRPERTGLHVLVTGQSTNVFAVNLLSPEESNLAAATTGRWGNWQNEREVRYEYESVLWIFLLSGLGILTVHLIALARSKVAV